MDFGAERCVLEILILDGRQSKSCQLSEKTLLVLREAFTTYRLANSDPFDTVRLITRCWAVKPDVQEAGGQQTLKGCSENNGVQESRQVC